MNEPAPQMHLTIPYCCLSDGAKPTDSDSAHLAGDRIAGNEVEIGHIQEDGVNLCHPAQKLSACQLSHTADIQT